MSNQILLNFAVPFTEIEAAGDVDFSYLRKAAIVVKAKDAAAPQGITEVYDADSLAVITDNTEGLGFLDGGLNRFYVISLTDGDLSNLESLLLDNVNKFATLHLSSDFTDAERLAVDTTFKGTISSEYDTKEDAILYAKTQCAGVSTQQSKGRGTCYALGRLLSQRTFWGNQQYIDYTGGATIETVSSLGLAESYFADRLTFWLFDEDEGTKLSGFFCGGKAITERYINEELKLMIQSEAVKYISVNQPMNIRDMRVALQNQLQAVVGQYIDDGYLDQDGTNEILVTDSNEMFEVSGTLRVKYSNPIWRMAVTAIKE